MLRRLLDAGADPDTATPGGETALMTAARTGNVDAVTLLLDRGANVNAKDTARAQTALMWAVTENHPDIVKLLVARGADVNAQTIVTMPKGEYVPARAGGASGPGIIRQRALPTSRRRHDAAALRGARRQRGDDAAAAGARRRHQADVRQSHVAAADRAAERSGRRWRRSCSRRAPIPNQADDYHRAALFAAIELRNFNHDKYPFLYDDGRDPLDLIKALLAKGADPNLQDRHHAGARADAVRRLVGRTSTDRRRSSVRRSRATSR